MAESMDNPRVDAIKKRLMFLPNEDFYFLTYNCLIVLKQSQCHSEATRFRDTRKLAYLIDFISDSYLVSILVEERNEGEKITDYDRSALSRAYSKARDRLPIINRLLYAMEKREMVSVMADEGRKTIDVFLREDNLPENFLASDLFEAERLNAKEITTKVRRLRTTTLNALLNNLFRNYGVKTWLD